MKTKSVGVTQIQAKPVQSSDASGNVCPPKVREFIIRNFLFGDGASLQDDTSFLGGGIIDSTGVLELIMFLQDTFGITIEPEEMTPQNLDSLRRIGCFLEAKGAKS